ncbi:nitrite reductase [Roseibium album]|uniref:Nitrite reductase n=1 Tax=Roseibium album TaxID=311410 RepID=A0A0M6ZPI7_9HYPH|nr:nitrite reductase [Roseibium album]MBG6160260.1 DNA-binding beta-propeller fold protein YncE/cytochrome c553 [Labrenzia sp. EL_162]MBG6198792.1 DNA-binding beta-propeller fold protein YncE/cytochrome c553 [Labrenzia sp. EL_159]CTQ63343.1 Nitrite reductase precursor [Roseibium album]CTQ69760.1 Nitrite reductase precursor [Roseibium album]CTQ80930.1 Nitrite reductase precursor [Roseibium album]
MIRLIVSLSALLIAVSTPLADPAQDYADNCQECHGSGRLGSIGPALIPQTLGRMRGPNLISVIRDGREATQMPAFGDLLSDKQIDALSAYLKQPLDDVPPWGTEEIMASRELNPEYRPADEPVWSSDPFNITLVVETGDHHVSVLDGDTFETLDRFPTPFAVHGGPKFSPNGRYVFIMSRDGWVQKYDLYSLQEVGRIRAGLNSRNIAMSHDGNWVAVANYLPNTLTILSTEDLSVAAVQEIKGKDGTPSRISAVYQAPPRESFVLALKDVPEIWEVFYGPNPPHYGFAHDWRIEGPARHTKPFPVRKITTPDYLDDFFFDQSYEYVMGASRSGDGGQVIDLVIGHKIADLDLPGMPHLGSGITWKYGDTTVMATPHLKDGTVSVIDMKTWKTVKQIETLGPGFFMRSHENSPYVWVDVFFGPNKDVMHVIDKGSLEIVKTLRPEEGATVAHVEFTRDGSHALVSIWEDDGAVIVYDADTLKEVRRLPMRKPSGKYNVWNKITFSEGTSH